MVAEHSTRRSRALADALATGLLLAAVAAGGLSFASTASAGVVALGPAAEPSATSRPASGRRLHHLPHRAARPEVPAQPRPPSTRPEPSAPAGDPVTPAPDPTTTSPPRQPSTPATHPPSRATHSHAKPSRTRPARHQPAPSAGSDRTEVGSAGPAVAARAANRDGTAVRDLSGVAAGTLSSQRPDTRGLDERFPDPVASPTPTTATRLSAGEARGRPEGYERSLVVSGLLGLGIAVYGLMMVTRRRRTW